MSLLELPGTGLRPRILRLGSGDPVVFLHDAGGLREDDPLLVELARNHEVVAPVHPGFDDLAELDAIRDVHDLALHYDDLLEALGLDSVPVVGHSFGGMVAAELAAHVPKRVSRLALLAPLGIWSDEHPTADLFTAFPLTIHELLWADPSGHSPAAQITGDALPPDQLQQLLGLLQGMTVAGKFLWPLPDRGLSRRLHRICAPTLVVWGRQDRLAPPAQAELFAQAIPDARVELVDGAGHMLPVEQTARVAELVSAFLAG